MPVLLGAASWPPAAPESLGAGAIALPAPVPAEVLRHDARSGCRPSGQVVAWVPTTPRARRVRPHARMCSVKALGASLIIPALCRYDRAVAWWRLRGLPHRRQGRPHNASHVTLRGHRPARFMALPPSAALGEEDVEHRSRVADVRTRQSLVRPLVGARRHWHTALAARSNHPSNAPATMATHPAAPGRCVIGPDSTTKGRRPHAAPMPCRQSPRGRHLRASRGIPDSDTATTPPPSLASGRLRRIYCTSSLPHSPRLLLACVAPGVLGGGRPFHANIHPHPLVPARHAA